MRISRSAGSGPPPAPSLNRIPSLSAAAPAPAQLAGFAASPVDTCIWVALSSGVLQCYHADGSRLWSVKLAGSVASPTLVPVTGDLPTATSDGTDSNTNTPTGLACSPGGLMLTVVTASGDMVRFDPRMRMPIGRTRVHPAAATSVTALGTMSVVTAGLEGSVRLWDLRMAKCMQDMPVSYCMRLSRPCHAVTLAPCDHRFTPQGRCLSRPRS